MNLSNNTKLNNMLIRSISGIILMLLAVYTFLIADTYVFLIGTITLSLIAGYEASKIILPGLKIPILGSIFFSIVLPILMFYRLFELYIFLIFVMIFISFNLKIFSRKPLNESINHIGRYLLVFLYVPICFSFFPLLKNEYGTLYVILLFIIIWMSDTGAYFVGVSIGKHKFSPLISPSKTWEGLIGGYVVTAIFITIYYFIVSYNISASFDKSFWVILIISLLSVDAGIVGDLSASIMKRDSNIKDSGKIIPGHGGVLDRVDSLLFGIPCLYILLKLSDWLGM